jgi:molybdenum cofactor biosynthesis enzyme MoaA
MLPVVQYKWQNIKTNNRYVSEMEVSITQRCNYNCMYCFTTADAAPLTDSFTLDEFDDLVGQALDCGFNSFAFTGGEPMVHKNFREMIQAVYSRGMTVSEIMTNGSLITDEFIDWLKNMYYLPRFCISFDGINGKHDMIRQTHSENIVLDNIRKLLKKGFKVKVVIG